MPRRLLFTFVVRLAIAYVILVIPWPGVDAAFGSLYRHGANLIARATGLHDYVALQPSPSHHPRGDIELKARNPQTGNGLKIEYGSRDWGYLPLAAGLALWIAVPPVWPARLRAGVLLMAFLMLFVLLRIAVGSVYGLGAVGAIRMSPRWLEFTGDFMLAFSGTPILSYVIPVLVWLLVLCRTYDFKSALARDGST